MALEILGKDTDGKKREEIKEIYDQLVEEGQIVFTTFHQSMGYEDFVEGIKPKTENGKITYEVEDGIFKRLCTEAKYKNYNYFEKAYQLLIEKQTITDEIIKLKTPSGKTFGITVNSNDNLNLLTGEKLKKQGVLTKENIFKQINGEQKFKGWEGYFTGVIEYLEKEYNFSNDKKDHIKKYVIIIDEINRGNISAIFGELITLIEDDKRLGEDEALEIVLPYSKEKFGVPNNIYIIGTMNTADRSVEALDTALRRRFSFKEMPPKLDLPELETNIYGIPLSDYLKIINERIEVLIDRDHLLGHASLMKVKTPRDLKMIFRDKFLPQLQEYFFGNYEKIAMIIGEDFFHIKDSSKIVFSGNNNGDTDKKIYHIKNLDEMDDADFSAAVKKMINFKETEIVE